MIRDLIATILELEATIGVIGLWGLTALALALTMAMNRLRIYKP